jgi:hypothetical protein
VSKATGEDGRGGCLRYQQPLLITDGLGYWPMAKTPPVSLDCRHGEETTARAANVAEPRPTSNAPFSAR